MTDARCSRGEKRAASAYKWHYNTPLRRCQQLFCLFSEREIYNSVTTGTDGCDMMEDVMICHLEGDEAGDCH